MAKTRHTQPLWLVWHATTSVPCGYSYVTPIHASTALEAAHEYAREENLPHGTSIRVVAPNIPDEFTVIVILESTQVPQPVRPSPMVRETRG